MSVSPVPQMRPVKTLAPEVARKIAAGEVIDRPAAVLREFLDNAVDAGADRITAEIEEGGTALIRVSDNGCGMTKEDLLECAKPHATSKIVSDTDLATLSTLGFRGEALCSVAAVSRLQISTGRNGCAWSLETSPDGTQTLNPAAVADGTIAACKGLFENFPARRRFLKRAQAEAALCRQIFIEKAMPFPQRAFRFISDGKIRMDLSAGQSLAQRFCTALDMAQQASLFYEVRSKSPDIGTENSEKSEWRFTVVLGETGIHRSDRKLMYVFVNGRRVQEYALLQAMDYGAQGYFPNGTHPAACLFLDIDPALADFNIHPAKKEVRFKDIAPIHRALSAAVRNFYRDLTVRSLVHTEKGTDDFQLHFDDHREEQAKAHESILEATQAKIFTSPAVSAFAPSTPEVTGTDTNIACRTDKPEMPSAPYTYPRYASTSFTDSEKISDYGETGEAHLRYEKSAKANGAFTYLGTALGVFLIAEKNNELYLVDQHAGHERILFNRFLESAGQKQMLLVPLVIETPSVEDDRYLETLLPELEKAGFLLKNCGDGRWEVFSVPVKWQGNERDLQSDLLDKHFAPNEIIRSLAATSSCRAAVKDGHILDRQSATELLENIFALPDPHCPHGRPIWTVISKEQLFSAVRRTE